MKRRAGKRRKRGRLAVTLLVAGAAVLVAAAVWWKWPTLLVELRPEPRQVEVEQPKRAAVPPSAGEDFSAAERQGLEDILKRHGAGKQQ